MERQIRKLLEYYASLVSAANIDTNIPTLAPRGQVQRIAHFNQMRQMDAAFFCIQYLLFH